MSLISVESISLPSTEESFFERLHTDREKIEAGLEESLTWRNPEGAKMCRVYARRLVDLANRDDWPNQFDWLEEQLRRFDETFRNQVKKN